MSDEIRVFAEELDDVSKLREKLRDRSGEHTARRLVSELVRLDETYGLDGYRILSEPNLVQGFGTPDPYWRIAVQEIDIGGAAVCFTVLERQYFSLSFEHEPRPDEWLLVGVEQGGESRLLQHLGHQQKPVSEVADVAPERLRELWGSSRRRD